MLRDACGFTVPSKSAWPRAFAGSDRRRRLSRVLGALAMSFSSGVLAEPVLHEYIELGPGQGSVEPTVTGEHGAPPRPGSPDGELDPGSDARSGPTPSSSVFSIDRDTSRPERVSYADPFTPTVVPFKRSIVYDAVNRDGDLLVQDTSLRPVEVLRQASVSDEHFHASLTIDLTAGQPSAIPSVAPHSRLVLARAEPPVELSIGVDSADNWFVRSTVSRQVQLTLQVVADRRVFGSPFRDASWAELGRAMPALPPEVKSSALEVARALGVGAAAPPARAVARLVEHFRRFSPSSRQPTSHGLALYRELALTARGICRHRAYAFMITALGLGIPTRMAMNEAHAWVEVFDGDIWHRIDLGGAAEHLEMDDEGRPRHVEPRDPFSWPDPNESGLALAEHRVVASSASGGAKPAESTASGPRPATSPPPTGAEAPVDPGASAPLPTPTEPLPAEPEGKAPEEPGVPALAPARDGVLSGGVTFNTGAARAERGKTLAVSGWVKQDRRACNGSRVDVLLESVGHPPLALGTLVSDERGEFRGRLVIPWNAPLGEHTLSAQASGICGPGS
jgi:hypothetical protein